MPVLYIEVAAIFIIIFGSFAASYIEKRRAKKLSALHSKQENLGIQNGTNYEAALVDIKQKSIFQFGREQFKKLVKQNLSVPVTML